MNFDALLNEKVLSWMEENLHQNPHELAFKKSPFPDLEMKDLVQQIQGRQIAKDKFSELNQRGIIFPPKLNLEQTSSQSTAEYKANLVNGNSLLDVTGGFGIDSIYFAKKFKKVRHFEINGNLQKMAAHNFQVLGLQNIESKAGDGLEFLENVQEKFDVIFVDPSRRNQNKQKVFLLEDLTPNILEIQEQLLQKSNQVLMKLSPLMDITYLTKNLNNLTEIHVVAVKNEVKEILILMNENPRKSTRIKAINLETEDENFEFEFPETLEAKIDYSGLKEYLYEPNAAIQKSGGNDVLGLQFGLQKLHPNTQLYVSEELYSTFPGRIYKVLNSVKNPKVELKNKSIQALHRNFPKNLVELKKQYKFTLDGSFPILFTKTIYGVHINYLEKIKL